MINSFLCKKKSENPFLKKKSKITIISIFSIMIVPPVNEIFSLWIYNFLFGKSYNPIIFVNFLKLYKINKLKIIKNENKINIIK